MGVLQGLGSNDTISDLLEDDRNTKKTVSRKASKVRQNTR
jgi:hypothetical protein